MAMINFLWDYIHIRALQKKGQSQWGELLSTEEKMFAQEKEKENQPTNQIILFNSESSSV